jgi:hypothetical protein
MEWWEGPEVAGDFAWPGVLDYVVVNNRVREFLERSPLTGFKFGPVEVTRPKRRKRGKSDTALPSDREPLWELITTSVCHLDLARSGRTLTEECDVCGRKEYSVAKDASIVVDASTWDMSDFFRIREWGVVNASKKAAKTLMNANFTNLTVERCGTFRRGKRRRGPN